MTKGFGVDMLLDVQFNDREAFMLTAETRNSYLQGSVNLNLIALFN